MINGLKSADPKTLIDLNEMIFFHITLLSMYEPTSSEVKAPNE